jgi:hypothetical protein
MQLTQRRKPCFTREEAVVHALASARIEGIALDKEAQAVLERWASGDYSPAELEIWIGGQILRAKTDRDA